VSARPREDHGRYPGAAVTLPIPTRACSRVALATALAGSFAAAASALPGLPQSATASLSSARAGARPVALTLELEYDMQCGYPGPGPVVVGLPAAEHVPVALARSQVLVNGHPAASVQVSGHRVDVGLAPAPQVMCDVIGPGRLTIVFSSAAGLGNPARAGSYTIDVTRASTALSARLTVQNS
jgi:hypothetical protein